MLKLLLRVDGENNIINGTIIESDSRQCKVKTNNGELIHANPVISNNIGDATSMSLRPERVLINPSEEIPNKFKAKIEEVILATSSTVEGDATASFINEHLESVKVSRISYGIPIGGELEYVDSNTIARAIQGRIEI